jgi:putative FmdB family regulatory protein
MPRYRYYCENCEQEFLIFHGINEAAVDCRDCEIKQTMKKLLSTPIIPNNKIVEKESPVGSLTKEYIESNREVLQTQKQQLEGKEYEPS